MLPQKPYVPLGTLRRATAYPAAAEDWTVEQIGEALDKVGLGHLKDKIEEDAPWDPAERSSGSPSHDCFFTTQT